MIQMICMFLVITLKVTFSKPNGYSICSLVPQGGPVCEECPLGLNAFLSTRPPKGLKNIRQAITSSF